MNIKKVYPNAVVLRPALIIIAVVVIVAIFILVFININRNSHVKKETKQQIKTNTKSAEANDKSWYSDEQVHKNSKVKKVARNQSAVDTTLEQTQTSTTRQSLNRTDGIDPEEAKKIMSAPISSNQLVDNNESTSKNTFSSTSNFKNSEPDTKDPDDQNVQGAKKAFLKTNNQSEEVYLHEKVKNPISPYEVKAGTIIPAVLITGINSDLPGQVTGQVRSNVYDTVGGKYILIPQGSKLTGLYDSQIVYGQERVLVVWKRIIFPNGQSISLEGMPGVDLAGYAGFSDRVNNHYMKIFGSVLLMSVISAGAQLSQPQQQVASNGTTGQLSVSQTLAASLGINIMNTTNTIVQKNLGIQPTLEVSPGYLFNVAVTKDMVFPGAYAEETEYD